jgi:hypothetical protein
LKCGQFLPACRCDCITSTTAARAATTLFYGPLGEALTIAAQQEEDVQAGLYLATENDVVAYLDLEE